MKKCNKCKKEAEWKIKIWTPMGNKFIYRCKECATKADQKKFKYSLIANATHWF